MEWIIQVDELLVRANNYTGYIHGFKKQSERNSRIFLENLVKKLGAACLTPESKC